MRVALPPRQQMPRLKMNMPENNFRFPNLRLVCLCAGLALLAVPLRISATPALRGMVASVHPMATEAGLDVLKHGGNAIDAAVAVGLTLGVVDTDNSGIGGGCFMLIRLANGSFVA